MSRGISLIRKLLEGNESYPPSEDLWHQIVRASKRPTPERQFRTLQDKMRQETNIYKPALPEPSLARFFYQGEYYYLDDHNQIYKTDPGNPLVGNHVGEIKTASSEPKKYEVTISGKVIHTIRGHDVKEQEIHKKSYYIDEERKVYQGIHPKHPYLYQIGQLSQDGKIQLE